MASSMPPPRQWPATAATVIAGSARSRSTVSRSAASIAGTRSGVWSWTAVPAEKARPPAPRTNTTASSRSCASSPTASRSAASAAVSRTLSGGRSRVMVPVRPSRA